MEMNQKLVLKFENGALEQTYKINRLEKPTKIEDINLIFHDDFVKDVEGVFALMKNNFFKNKSAEKLIGFHDYPKII